MSIRSTLIATGMIVAFGAGMALADNPPKNPRGPAPQGKAWKKGQGWDFYAATFDADKDGMVTKEEMLAKKPGFDRLDADKDGFVTREEVDAVPAGQRNPNLKGWVDRFDDDKDGKVSAAEWDARRVKVFDAADKNRDGAIEKDEFTGALAGAGGTDA